MEDIRDIKGLVPVPHSWWWLLSIIVLGAIAWWLWRRKKPTVATETVPPPTPLEVALAALEQLRAQSLPVELFYTRLSDIVRHYIDGQFGLRAPERTTEEFLAESTLPGASMALLSTFLQESDLVKFARLRPGRDDMERAFDAAEKFVRETQA